MGSPCHLTLYAPKYAVAQRVAHAVIADVSRLEQRYSRFRPDSLLSEINRSAHCSTGVILDEEMAGLLDYAQNCYKQSDGLFDITSGILRKAWNFSNSGTLPQQYLIDELLERVGWDKLIWQRPVLRFAIPGLELDLGGIAKEYAADRAVTLCHDNGISNGVVNFGGDLRVIGPRPDGEAWNVGIQDPRRPGKIIATLALRRGAVATSGDYERCMLVDGKRYGHILNPKTGWPVVGMASVSVVAPFAVIAGSASTIGMLKGNNGPEWLSAMGLPSLWVTEEGQVGQWDIELGKTGPNCL